MKCYKCGKEIPDGRMNCSNCGAMILLNTENPAANSNPQFELMETQKNKKLGLALASMILGILSLVFVWTAIIPILCGIAGIILGGYSLSTKRGGKGMSIAGILCSAIALVLLIIMLVVGAGALIRYDEYQRNKLEYDNKSWLEKSFTEEPENPFY